MASIDLGAQRDQAAFLTGSLKRHGLPLGFGKAIEALAKMIKDHEHFGYLVMQAEPDFRQNFYDAVRPHLRFKAKPIDSYVIAAKDKAEREQLPTIGPDGNLRAFRSAQDASTIRGAEDALSASLAKRTLTLKCSRCTRQQSYSALEHETPTAVVRRARLQGWAYDYKSETPKEICPECNAR
jgi:hypothetical protein